jgi:hypothetical protein
MGFLRTQAHTAGAGANSLTGAAMPRGDMTALERMLHDNKWRLKNSR